MLKEKLIAKQGKLLYCEELKIYCKATNDDKHTWVEVDESEVEEHA